MTPAPPGVPPAPGALVAAPARGRTFSASRRVQPEEAAPDGRLRLDAAARYLANVAMADVEDAGLDEPLVWLARRTEIRVLAPLRHGEAVGLTTFCAGTGPCWAERRTSLRGEGGGSLEAVALWVCFDLERGRPAPLSEAFHRHYGEAAGGRRVKARLAHPDPPPGATRRWFPLRATDYDAYGHVNNAVAFAIVEDELRSRGGGAVPGRVEVEVEYRDPIGPGEAVEVVTAGDLADCGGREGLGLWVVAGGAVRISGRIRAAGGA
ncbi:MAG: acyl-ACP thioesterase domain-containing protein [Acidimicrobiales bacterium]